MKDTLAFSHALLSMTLQGPICLSQYYIYTLHVSRVYENYSIYSFQRVSRYIKIKSNMEIKVSLINFFQVEY